MYIHCCLDSSCLADAPPLCVESRRRLPLFICVHREREGDGGGEGRARSDRNATRKEAATAHAAEDEHDGVLPEDLAAAAVAGEGKRGDSDPSPPQAAAVEVITAA